MVRQRRRNTCRNYWVRLKCSKLVYLIYFSIVSTLLKLLTVNLFISLWKWHWIVFCCLMNPFFQWKSLSNFLNNVLIINWLQTFKIYLRKSACPKSGILPLTSKPKLPGVCTRSWVSRLNSSHSQTFPTVSNWLNFNFDYFLIGPKVTILNTSLSLAASDLTMFPCCYSY